MINHNEDPTGRVKDQRYQEPKPHLVVPGYRKQSDETHHGQTNQGEPSHGELNLDDNSHGEPNYGKSSHGEPNHGKLNHGVHSHGESNHGESSHGETEHNSPRDHQDSQDFNLAETEHQYPGDHQTEFQQESMKDYSRERELRHNLPKDHISPKLPLEERNRHLQLGQRSPYQSDLISPRLPSDGQSANFPLNSEHLPSLRNQQSPEDPRSIGQVDLRMRDKHLDQHLKDLQNKPPPLERYCTLHNVSS